MSRLAIAAAAGAVLVTGAALYVWFASAEPQHGIFRPDEPQLVALGKEIYADECASCHGTDLEGEENWKQPKADGRLPAPPHDETGHTWHHPDRQLFDITKHGIAKLMDLDDYRTDMPVYGEILSDEEIIAVLSYIKAQWPQDIRERHDELNRKTSED